MRSILFTILILLGALLMPTASPAQNSTPTKFNDAIKRSKSAAEIVTKLAELSGQGISRRLIDTAEAIGIFPCHKKDALIEYAVFCPGAISRQIGRAHV